MGNPVVEVSDLSVLFGLKVVLYRVEFKLYPGQVALIVGANGSGKSTFVHTLCGLTTPRSGTVRVLGTDPRKFSRSERRRIGVMLHKSMLYSKLTAQENLELYARLYGVSEPQQRAFRWIERVGLRSAAELMVHQLSRGMEQRLALARALLAEPEVVLLDEPFAALDEDGVNLACELLKEARDRGAALVLTSHEGSSPFIGAIEPLVFRLTQYRLHPVERENRRRGPWRWMLT